MVGMLFIDELHGGRKWVEGAEVVYKIVGGEKRLVRAKHPIGSIAFFEGAQGAERKVRREFSGGEKQFYEGEKGAERKVRIEYPGGQKEFYEGEKGAERLVRVEFSDGKKHFLEGEKGAERTVRIEHPDGKKEFYEGEEGAERNVRTVWPLCVYVPTFHAMPAPVLPTTATPPHSPPPDTATAESPDELDDRVDAYAPTAKRARLAGPARDAPNGKPEREFVRKVAAEWEAAGIAVVGKEACEEIVMRAPTYKKRRLDLHCAKDERVCLVEFKAGADEFMHGVGQLVGYERRMRNPAHDAGDGGAYAAAHAKDAASLCVATPTKPDQFDINTARKNVPTVGAWWPGCPPPL